jgi:hypothetical protein
VTIDVTEFQSFASRVGVDTVLALRFPYSEGVVETVKEALRDMRHLGGVKNPGGWLADRKLWFVERVAWPHVRGLLLARGHMVREDDEWGG